MNGLSIYFINLGILILTSLVFLLIGRQFQKRSILTFKEAFFSLFFGILFLSTVFAIVQTGGSTIMLSFLILALLYCYEKRKRPIINSGTPVLQNTTSFILLGLLFGAFFVFTWSFLTLIQSGDFPYYIPSGTELAQNDYLINVFRSYYLGLTGEENYYHYFNTIDAAYHGPKPYHYLEMWTTAALTSIFGGLAAEKFVLVATPLYHLAAFLGILALWEKYQFIKWYHLLLSAAFLFFAGLHFEFYKDWKILNFSLPIFTHRVKMCTYYPFILAFLLQFNQEKPQQSILLLIGLIVATVVVVPALLGGVFLFLGYQFFTGNPKKNVLITAGYVAITTMFIFLFYRFTETGQFNIRANAGTYNAILHLLTSLIASPLDKMTNLLLVLLKEAILYIPLLTAGFLLLKEEKKILAKNLALLVLIFCIVISGAGAYILFTGEKDATQLFYNPANALLNCLLIWTVIRLLSSVQKNVAIYFSWKHYGLGILLIVMFTKQFSFAIKRNLYPVFNTQKYSPTYLQQIKTYLLTDKRRNIGASIKGGKDYNSAFSKQTVAYTLGYYLAYMENGSIAIQISDFDIPKLNWSDQQDRASNLFYRFVAAQKAAQTFTSIGRSQTDFIQKYNLDFVVISKNGKLRQEVQNLVDQTFTDKVSGERFLIIRK